MITKRSLLLLLFVAMGICGWSQGSKTRKPTEKKYPATFAFDKTAFDHLFDLKNGQTVAKTSPYLDKSTLLKNSKNGDIRFLRLKLDYFKKSYLMIQVNGVYSTQIFIMSDDKSVFYKGKLDGDQVLMTKCSEDDIVSE